ncbi:tetraspanin-8-like [Erpetoichthys calabaricus]|uniref:tetraspanin-8-like n=1 Tax=Erpetoichthys calabaricus TaxID=27687 RepID=UPI002234905F|nr:tetraspanin-8-like [Erpetoichthys calabaricus]
MAKVNVWVKRLLIIFNSVFAVAGCLVFLMGVIGKKYVHEVDREEQYGRNTLMTIGVVTIFLAFLGGYGAKSENKCLLFSFFTGLFSNFLLLLLLTVAVVVLRPQIFSTIRGQFGSHLLPDEENRDFADIVQSQLKCCGMDNGYKDWGESIPVSCRCPVVNDPLQCTSVGYLSVYKQSCSIPLFEVIDKASFIIFGFTVGFSIIALIGMALSITLLWQLHRQTSIIQLDPPKYSEIAAIPDYKMNLLPFPDMRYSP